MGGFESLEKQQFFSGFFGFLVENFVAKKKLGLKLGVQEDVEF